MRNLFLIFSFLLFTNIAVNAQHCPFDLEGIVVVKIHAEGDTAIIQNLNITLLDTLGNPVLKQDWAYRDFLGDTLRLWQNPSKTTFHTTIDCNHPADPRRIRFPFAKEDYVLVCPIYFTVEKYKIKIEDIDGEKNGGWFATNFYEFTREDLYSLCGTYNLKVYPDDQSEEAHKYIPVNIPLIRK